MKLLYVSNGNIPSRWAHTIQTMKMCEALAALVPSFALLIGSDFRGLFASRAPLFVWYGVRRPFRVRRIPLAWRARPAVFEQADNHAFHLQAVRYVRLVRPRIIYTRCHEVARQCLAHGFRVIFETHDGPGNPKTMRYLPSFAAARSLIGIVTTSEILKESFEREGIPGEKILVRPNAVDLDRFTEPPRDRAALRQVLGLDPNRPLVVYTGSLAPHKGIGTLLETARLLPAVDFLLMGGSEEQVAEWREKHADLGNVLYGGFVPNAEIPTWLQAGDVCVVPNSASDRTARWTFSLKLYEYMAARRPVVASDIPSLRATVEGGKEVLFFPPDDAEALGRAIVRLLEQPVLARQIADNAWRKAQSHSWDSRARDVLDAFAPELLGRRLGA